jgi:hypothetical protein
MTNIQISKRKLICASEVAELNDSERLGLVMVHVATKREMSEFELIMQAVDVMKVMFARNFSTTIKFERWWVRLKMNYTQMEALALNFLWVMDFMKAEKKGKPFEYVEGLQRFYNVKDRFEHVSAAEWTEGVLIFIDIQNGDSEKLYDLFFNFCRPERSDLEAFRASEQWNGDVREPFNAARAKERAETYKGKQAGGEVFQKDIDNLEAVMVAFLWWYDELLRSFFEEYTDLFGGSDKNKSEDDDEIINSGAGRYADGRGYVMILKNAAKKHYMGDFRAVQSEDVHVVYSLLLDDFYDDNLK